MEVEVHGEVSPQFETVRHTFGSLWHDIEVGAGLCVYLLSRKVIDLWAGFKDIEMTQPWQSNTLVNVYSTTKGITAIAAHQLIDQGRLDLDAPVARYWPEFAAAGKAELPVRYLLSHEAGLAAVKKPLAPTDLA